MPNGVGSRYLIVRLSAVGDCIVSMPIACALKRHDPQAFIAWVVEPLAAKLLRGHPCIDELIVVPRGWWKSPRELKQLRTKLRSLEIDTAIDVQSLTKSALVAWLSGAKRRIGLCRPWGRELSLVMNNVRVQPTSTHVVDAFLEMLRPLGIDAPQVEFRIPEDPAAAAKVAALIDREHAARPLAIINPGAGWASKQWPLDRYAQVAAYLGRRHGVRSIVVWHGDTERSWAEQIVAGSLGEAVHAPPTNLVELGALARRSVLFVGSDTGPLHLAAAVGTSCVGLYGTSHSERTGPYGPNHVRLQAWYQDGTSRQRRSAANTAMQAITVEDVCRACDQVLTRSRSRVA
jgi:lipopolysaccharide heptosyltransferase I